MRKLIEMDTQSTPQARNIHFSNLQMVVNYCENLTDCRRVMQLSHFGEVFDARLCKMSLNNGCDNCQRGAQNRKDVTEFARKLLQGVERLLRRSGLQGCFTVNHLVDIARGSKNKKLLQCHWDSDPAYGSGKALSAQDCGQIVRRMISDNFLREELVVTRDGNAVGYLKLGTNSRQLLDGSASAKVHLFTDAKLALEEANSETAAGKDLDDTLKKLEEECFNELKEAIIENFPEIKSVYAALPVSCYREIAEKLPDTKAKLQEVDQMTSGRAEKYGDILIAVTKRYVEKRMSYLEDKQAAEMLARDDEDDGAEFLGSAVSGGSSRSSGWIGKAGR